MSRLSEPGLEREETMRSCYFVKLEPESKARIKLSIRLGILAGIIWGLFFAAYYTMLPNIKFALLSATVCFIALPIFVFAWPLLVQEFKDAIEEGRIKRGL